MLSTHPFLAHLPDYLHEQQQRNRSPNTLIAYQSDLLELQTLLPCHAQPTRQDFTRALKQLSQRNFTSKKIICMATLLQLSY